MNNTIQYNVSFQFYDGKYIKKYDVVLMLNQFVPLEMIQLFRRIITVKHSQKSLQNFTVVVNHDGFHCFQFGAFKLKPDNFIPLQYQSAYSKAHQANPDAFKSWFDEYMAVNAIHKGSGIPGRKLAIQTSINWIRDHSMGPALLIGMELFHCNGIHEETTDLPEGFDFES